jgi:hypothetical protein
MISGGGAGRNQRPKAKADRTITAIIASVRAGPEFLIRYAQAGQWSPLSTMRQPLSARRWPHSTQKLDRCIAGDSVPIESADYIRLMPRAGAY